MGWPLARTVGRDGCQYLVRAARPNPSGRRSRRKPIAPVLSPSPARYRTLSPAHALLRPQKNRKKSHGQRAQTAQLECIT